MSAEDVFNGTVDVVTGMSPEDHKQTVLTHESIDHALDELAELTPPLSGLPAAPSRTELRRLHPQVLTIPQIKTTRQVDHTPVSTKYLKSVVLTAGPLIAATSNLLATSCNSNSDSGM
jgi:hypothetical protein